MGQNVLKCHNNACNKNNASKLNGPKKRVDFL